MTQIPPLRILVRSPMGYNHKAHVNHRRVGKSGASPGLCRNCERTGVSWELFASQNAILLLSLYFLRRTGKEFC
jgi:hypothetical protein